MENRFETQPSINVHGIRIFARNTILDLKAGYVSYASDLHETAAVLKGADGLGVMFLVINGDKRKEVEDVVKEYSQDKWLEEGLFGEIVAWACKHPDLNVSRCTMGRANSRCGLKPIKPLIIDKNNKE